MGKTQLAPGFRFHPTDVELVRYYLKRKVLGKKLLVDAIAEVDIYKFEPSDLPDMSYIRSGDLKWHFFCPKEKKYATGVRANRATGCGYWKTTGKERDVLCNAEVVGKIKTLVYHFGKSPRGERTDWVMHEYRLDDKQLMQMNVPQDTYVVCVVFKKDGPGPRNGAQYGAPFREEDWSDGEGLSNILATNNPTNLHGPINAQNPNKGCIGGMVSDSCVSDFLPATTTTTTTTSLLPCLSDAANAPVSITTTTAASVLPYPSDAANVPISTEPLLDSSTTAFMPEALQTPGNKEDDDIYAMLDLFVDDYEWLPFNELNNNDVRHDPGVSDPACLEGHLFNELPALSGMHNNSMARTPSSYDLLENSELYLELQDLTAPLVPQTNDSRSSSLNHQGHSGFPSANDDPYGFSASMGHRPDM